MTTPASPRPWTLADKSVRAEEWDGRLRMVADLDSVQIWCANGLGGSYPENRANGELIVEAVNAYDSLRALNEELIRSLDKTSCAIADMTMSKDFDCGNIRQYLNNTYKEIKETLRRARGSGYDQSG
jgi:hypothetical protein